MNNSVARSIIQRIRAEFLEMPGLSLRPVQVQRLCGVDGPLCQSVLEALVETGFLFRRSDGAYGRDVNPDISRVRQAKASLEPAVLTPVARHGRRAS